MTFIYNISPEFLQTCVTYQSKKNIDLEEVFKRLSFELGGDGKTIKKEQLDDYIDKAESGSIKMDSKRLSAFKSIQNNRDTISKGKDTISYDDIKDYPTLLAATLMGNFTATEIDDSTSSIQDAIYDYLVDYLGLSNKEEITGSDLTACLSDLISNTLQDDSNNEIIGTLTNMIAAFSPTSTIEAEA